MLQILIVDDDCAVRKALRIRLNNLGYEALEASTGRRAVELFEEHHPPMVLLDAALPDMSGFEVCQCIRSADPDRHTAIIFQTGATIPSNDYVDRCVEVSDADAYLRKPYEFNDLAEIIQKRLRRPALVHTLP